MSAVVEYQITIAGEHYEVELSVDVQEGEVRSLELDRCRVYADTTPTSNVVRTVGVASPALMAEIERRVDQDRGEIEDECRRNAYDAAMDSRISARKDGDR